MRAVPHLCEFYPGTFALQLRKMHGKTSVRVGKTSVRLRKTSEYSVHITKTPTHYKPHTNAHIETDVSKIAVVVVTVPCPFKLTHHKIAAVVVTVPCLSFQVNPS